jgi:hypothetical protein
MLNTTPFDLLLQRLATDQARQACYKMISARLTKQPRFYVACIANQCRAVSSSKIREKSERLWSSDKGGVCVRDGVWLRRHSPAVSATRASKKLKLKQQPGHSAAGCTRLWRLCMMLINQHA